MFRFLGLTGITLMLLSGMSDAGETEATTTSVEEEAPAAQDQEARPAIGCKLSTAALARRTGEIEDLFSGRTGTRELEDGYAFRFSGDGKWAARLLDFVNAERQCCQFFTFEIAFEPNQGPIWLRVRGSAEIKAFLEAIMGET